MDRFLKAKHWQLFTLLFGLPIVLEILFFKKFFNVITVQNMDDIRIYFAILIAIITFIRYSWNLSVGIKLQDKIPTELKIKTGMFKILWSLSLLYNLLISFLLFLIISGFSPQKVMDASWFAFFPLFILLFSFISIFCAFYCMYIIARTIKTAEIQRAARFDDFIGEFFLIIFFPIGIWFIQPRINKILTNDLNNLNKPISNFKIG